MSAARRRGPTDLQDATPPSEDGTGESTQRGSVPDFFIVGHAKSGTTALYEMLKRHPQIYMPEGKEPWFFSSDMALRFQRRRVGRPPETLEDYMALFADAKPGQRVGEASSSYLWSRTAAAAIAQVRPDARIIALLLQLLQNHVESEQDLRKAISLEALRREGKHIPRRSHRPQLLQYADHVRYVEQLRRYHELFGPEQVLVLIYEDFRRENEATVRAVLRFLELDDAHPVEVLKVNPTIRMRSQRLDDLVHSVSVGRSPLARATKAVVKGLAPGGAARRLLQTTQRHVVYGDPAPPDEEFMLELRRRFKGEVVAVSEYLDRDLVTLWGYEDVD
jgi:hypothetical protein